MLLYCQMLFWIIVSGQVKAVKEKDIKIGAPIDLAAVAFQVGIAPSLGDAQMELFIQCGVGCLVTGYKGFLVFNQYISKGRDLFFSGM